MRGARGAAAEGCGGPGRGAGRCAADGAAADIVHIVYRPGADQIPHSDAEFSRSSIAERREAGYRDMRAALAAEPWLRQERPAHLGALVHRVERGW